MDVKQIGRELGARYALEGSVRKAGNRVRITDGYAFAPDRASLPSDADVPRERKENKYSK